MADASVLSTVQTPVICDLCETTDINNQVIWYCKNCEASLCCKCQKEHLEGKPLTIFKRHRIVPRVEALKSRLSEDEPCSIHSDSNYSLHCNTCHQLVCNHCIIEEHNGHDFCKIEDAMETVRQYIIQYSDTIENTLLAECVAKESTITENHKRCEEFYATKESDVEKKREKLISEVNRLCDDVLHTIASEKKKNMSIIEQDKIAVQAKIQEIKMLMDTKKEAMEKSNSEMIKFMKEKPAIGDFRLPTVSPLQLPSLIDEQLEGLHVVQSYTATDNYSNKPHPGDNEVPHTTSDGNLVKQSMTTDDNQVKQSMTTDDNQVKQSMTTGDNQVKQSMTTDVNQVKQPMITGDNQVKQSMATDNKDNNQVPQSADTIVTDVQVLSRHKYDIPVRTIASVDEERVWLCGKSSTKLLLVNKKGQILNQITTGLNVDSFTILTSGDMITTHYKEKCYQVMSETGQVTTTINTHPDYPGGVCLTSDRKHIAVCLYSPEKTTKLAVFELDGQRKETFQYTDRKPTDFYAQRVTTNQSGDYCVVHCGLYTVFVVSKSGVLKFTYNGSNCTPKTKYFYPFDITCDKYNRLLISDYSNHTIHMVDQQGQFLRYLLTPEHGIVEPRALSLDKEGKLWVGLKNGFLLVVKYLK